MLDERLLDRTNRLINLEYESRRKKLAKDITQIKREMKGAPYSSVTINRIHERYESELKEITNYAGEKIIEVHKNLGALFTETLGHDFKEYIENKINEILSILATVHQKDTNIPQVPHKKQLDSARQEAIDQSNIKIDLYVDSLIAVHGKKKRNNVIFISHAEEDREIAGEIKKQIENVLGSSVEVFVSSVKDAIKPGSEWFDRIIDRLVMADAVIVIITNTSITRQFVWFEIGFSWLRKLEDKCQIYPICIQPISVGKLPEPLSRLQAVPLEDESRTQVFYESIVKQFGAGNIDKLDYKKIKSVLQNYNYNNKSNNLQIDMSNEANILLIEATKDNNGYILKYRTFDGTEIQTNGHNLIADQSPRIVAEWEHALKELISAGYVEERDAEGETFAVTHLGYEYVDKFKGKHVSKDEILEIKNFNEYELAIIKMIGFDGEVDELRIIKYLTRENPIYHVDFEAAKASLIKKNMIIQTKYDPVTYRFSPEGAIWASQNKHLWMK